MSLSPIQMFQNNGANSIVSLLQGGPNAVARIMDQAIQIGRQMSDKQLAQERDMLAMRQQETALQQRRAENLQQNNEDAQNFARSAFETDRSYAANREDAAFDKQRITANDMFSREMEMRRLGLSEKKLGMMSAEAEAERRMKTERLLNFEDQFTPKGEPPLPTDQATPNPEILANEKLKRDEANMIGARALFGVKDEAADTRSKNIISDVTDQNPRLPELVPSPASTVLAPDEDGMVLPRRDDLASVNTEIDMLKRSKPPEGANEEAVRGYYKRINDLELKSKELSAKPETTSTKPVSPTAERREIENLLLNQTFFQPQSKFLREGSTPEDIAAAEAWDKNKFEAEANAAMRMSEDEYASKGGNKTEASDAARRKFYRYARRVLGGGVSTGGGAVSLIPGI